jgi:hypothetical protein
MLILIGKMKRLFLVHLQNATSLLGGALDILGRSRGKTEFIVIPKVSQINCFISYSSKT